jgi:carotenoid cleavage dioxygenase
MDTAARLVRWTFDPDAATDAIRRSPLDDMTGEFPRIDDRRTGLRHRYGGFTGRSRPDAGLDSIVWLDLAAGHRSVMTVPDGDALSEPVFVARHDEAPEGDGWLLAVAWRAEQQRSELLVFDAEAVAQGPLATVQLPDRVPFGFHGNWVGDR